LGATSTNSQSITNIEGKKWGVELIQRKKMGSGIFETCGFRNLHIAQDYKIQENECKSNPPKMGENNAKQTWNG